MVPDPLKFRPESEPAVRRNDKEYTEQMNPLSTARPGWLAPLILSLAAAAFLFVAPVSADADVTVQGKAAFTLGAGNAGKSLARQGVRVGRIAPARVKRLARNRSRVVAPASGVALGPARVGMKGGFTFRRGKRVATAHRLVMVAGKNVVMVRGKLSGRAVWLFRVAGRAKIFRGAGTANAGTGEIVTSETTAVRLSRGRLRLTPVAAKLIRRKLRLRKPIPATAYGAMAVNARRISTKPVLSDPYLAECGLEATSLAPGDLTWTPPPTLGGTVQSIESPVSWGIKASLRGYLFGTGGSMLGLDGAEVNYSPGPPMPSGFTFPAAPGEYSNSGAPAVPVDEQAIINGTGTILLCHQPHGFRIALSDPTIVVDYPDSRLIVDVDSNNKGVWIPNQRVDFATLNLSEGDRTFSGDEAVEWKNVPATLTAQGSTGLTLCDADDGAPPGSCAYEAGAELDPITFSVDTSGP